MDNLTWVLISVLVAFLVGLGIGHEIVKRQAIAADVAEYRVDPKTGVVKFTFKQLILGKD